MAPRSERVASEAVDEDDIRLSQGIVAAGDRVQAAQGSVSLRRGSHRYGVTVAHSQA